MLGDPCRRKLKAIDVIEVLSDLYILRGRSHPCVAAHIRSDKGPEFVRQDHLAGRPWENGYIEKFNARLRDELLQWRDLLTLREGWWYHNAV
jgi:putative transposase